MIWGAATPDKEKTAAALPGNATAFKNRHSNPNSATRPSARDTAKAEATIFAGFALRGFSVYKAADGFLVNRWGLTRHCPDLETLRAFAKQVGVAF
jgi:hypothetical protein